MPSISVCLSPNLINLFELKGNTVVVVDILRATSCITTALGCGIKSIKPVSNLEECLALGNEGYITAGERNGKKVDGFDLGNSPFGFMDEKLQGKKIAFTTTNGTQAINLSERADLVIAGSFLNIAAIKDFLYNQASNVTIVCAGWKGMKPAHRGELPEIGQRTIIHPFLSQHRVHTIKPKDNQALSYWCFLAA